LPTDTDDELLEFDALEDEAPSFERFQDSRKTAKAAKIAAKAAKLLSEADENANFKTTYTPSRHEAAWLFSSLRPFFVEQNLIDDLMFQVKGGKEASVYCASVHPSVRESFGTERIAAKVYRPREFRNLRNDHLYRAGRAVLTDEGRAAKSSDTRLMKAVSKKTDFGAQVQHTSWLLYEYKTLQQLFDAGCCVPKPYAVAENAILMGFIGSETLGAPTLIEVNLTRSDAQRAYDKLVHTLKTMIGFGLVHGDLSAYNILYWDDEPTIIDFPQVVKLSENEHAEEILTRDLTRLVDYFTKCGVTCSVERLKKTLGV
jgi:RIO kinase 1